MEKVGVSFSGITSVVRPLDFQVKCGVMVSSNQLPSKSSSGITSRFDTWAVSVSEL